MGSLVAFILGLIAAAGLYIGLSYIPE